MKIHLLCAFILVTFSANSQLQQFTISFENDESTLDPEDLATIGSVTSLIRDESKEILGIDIYGYADTNASREYNIALSERRATIVHDELLPLLPLNMSQLVKVSWYGEEIPEELKRNLHYSSRSVDIMIRYKIAVVQKEQINDLLEQLYTPVQSFFINNDRDTVIRGESGTLVVIPAHSFIIPKSCAGGLIQIVLQESYDPVSIMMNNLVTMDNGKQLESDGMVFIKAHLCGRILTPVETAKFTFLFPSDNLKEGMNLYAGGRDDAGNMNWNLTSTPLRQVSAGQVDDLLRRWHFYKYTYFDYCPFFFCKIGNFFAPGTDHSRKTRVRYKLDYAAYRQYLDSMYTVYGVKDIRSLMQAIEIRKQEQMTAAIANGDVQNWGYYAASVSNLGWMNCDRFMSMPERKRVAIVVREAPAENVSVSLLFTQYNSMMRPGTNANNELQFSDIGEGEICYVVAMKYENNIPYLSIQKIDAEDDLVVQPEYKAYTVEDMKKVLSGLGRG